MKKLLFFVLICLMTCSLFSCEQADAIKNGIKEKLPKPEEYEIIEPIMEAPQIEDVYKNTYSLLVVQEVKDESIIAVIDNTEIRYSVPNWFKNIEIKPGTYLLVEHADNSLPTSPMQFGFIYSMNYYTENGSVIEGIKP